MVLMFFSLHVPWSCDHFYYIHCTSLIYIYIYIYEMMYVFFTFVSHVLFLQLDALMNLI